MKKCPTCDKTYEDSMRFCQVDGSELVDDAPALDPYATMVGQKLDFVPEADKTTAEETKADEIALEPLIHETTGSVPIAEPDEVLEMPGADPLKTMYVSEAELKEVFNAEGKSDATPPPSPFSTPESPFNQPSFQSKYSDAETVLEQKTNSPFQTPEPAPVAQWQDKQAGSSVSYQQAAAGSEGESKALAIGSLVSGILSCLCCFSIVTGPAAVIMGFIAKKNADENPAAYGGRGFALGGMVTGAIGFLLGIVLIILQVFFGILGNLLR